MSCCAIAKWTIDSRYLKVDAGSEKSAVNSACATVGYSSAASVCRLKRLLPLAIASFLLDSDSATSASGNARRMSTSLRAATVVAAASLPAPMSALVWIWISRSVAVNDTRSPSLRTRMLARMGNVCRRSTMPLTTCNGFSNASRDALTSCISSFLFFSR